MLLYLAKKVFGTRNDRVLKSIHPYVQKINDLEKEITALSDDALRAKTSEFKERISRGESVDSVLPESFAVVREASKRVLGMRHFDVQLIGGCVLHRGMISEMKTGEGKTLVATLPSYLNALSGKGVHVVTVNDYLAKRDAEWMGRVHTFLGLSVGVVYSGMHDQEKKDAYASDITYGQNNEFGFDYLRDNMKFSLEDTYQRGHNFAIVDEVDSILIDEARTPLIISGPAEESTDKYYEINNIIPHLEKDKHFEIDLKTKNPTLTEPGIARAEELLKIDNLYDPSNIDYLHHVNQSLKAYVTMERDVDYVVKDGQIIIVDEFTGRLMPGRRWSNGLHQAVEAKEGLKVARENVTLASITFQNYFRLYNKLSGMTGTADTEASEFSEIYKLEVVVIPTNRPMTRQDLSDVVYRTKKEKYDAVIEDIVAVQEQGQPVLVGTVSIEQSEYLSRLLKDRGIVHNVLNAKQHEREAEIVAQAGRYAAVTISTNMAGRGTDILLGGNPEFLAFAESGSRVREDPLFQELLSKYKVLCEEEKKKVVEAGGLFIMGTERHESRRIDNQLRGRAGRQGDPGVSRFYISLEDDLMKRFGGERMQTIMSRLGWEEGAAIDGNLISRSIETAQKRVEGMHFESRKHVTEYDDVMNKQRQVLYQLRNQALSIESIEEEVQTMIYDVIEALVLETCPDEKKPIDWDLDELKKNFIFLFQHEEEKLLDDSHLTCENIFNTLIEKALQLYQERAEANTKKLLELQQFSEANTDRIQFNEAIPSYREIEQRAILEAIDFFWNIHLQNMDDLRDGIGLRGYGQKNPLYEYQREAFIEFETMLFQCKQTVIRKLMMEEIVDVNTLIAEIEAEEARRKQVAESMQMVHESVLEGGADDSKEDRATQSDKDPEAQRSKLEAQKKARRKLKK
jgi:preprotein translocase subunit SecA